MVMETFAKFYDLSLYTCALVMNCQELVISIYQNNKTDKIQAYILEIQSAFQSLNSSGLHSLKIVNWEDFVSAILSNPQSINFEIS